MDLSPGTLIDPPKFLAGRITTDFLSGIGLLNISEPVRVGMVPNGHRSGRAFSRLTISREPVDRLNPHQSHQIFGGYSHMRWLIVSALFLSSFSFVFNAEYANKHSNKNESPPDFAELH